MGIFDQVNPFSYEVNAQGLLKDTFKRKMPYWNELHTKCIRRKVPFIPTIFWTHTEDMHNVLSDAIKLKNHTTEILNLVEAHKLDGININYERISSKDRPHYLSFLQDLSKELHKRKLELHVSMGGRTSDSTIGLMNVTKPKTTDLLPVALSSLQPEPLKTQPITSVSLSPGSGKEALHYKKVIAECCDQVHIMGYDEWGTPHKYDEEHLKSEYYISHSSNQWIEQILTYALTYIPRHKIVLGLPTYGLEFTILNEKGKITYKKKRNITCPIATELAHAHKKKPLRTHGGELSFTYTEGTDTRYVCYLDAQCIKEKIALVKKYRIKGINIFTINGNEDYILWSVLEKELLSSSLK